MYVKWNCRVKEEYRVTLKNSLIKYNGIQNDRNNIKIRLRLLYNCGNNCVKIGDIRIMIFHLLLKQ